VKREIQKSRLRGNRERKEGAIVVSVLWSLAAVPILVVYSRSIWVFPAPGVPLQKMEVHFLLNE